MPKYHTGLVIEPIHHKILDHTSLYRNCEFITDPSKKHYSTKDGRGTITKSDFEKRNNPEGVEDLDSCLELIIEAPTPEDAKNDLALIHAGLKLGWPDPDFGSRGLDFPIEYSSEASPLIMARPFWDQFTLEDRLDIGLYTLSKAKGNPQYTYALEKYKFSLDLDAITAHSGHPRYGQIFENETKIHATHVHQLTSIIMAYSAIEEMGCEIRASRENPRFIKGKWNPKVWDEAAERLSAKGIDMDRKFTWIMRGNETPIHKEIPGDFGTPSKENDGETIKDRDMHIIEALQMASWLRNEVASHKFRELSPFISPYDVHNAQTAARIIIMQCLGVWEYVHDSNRKLSYAL